MLFRCGRRARLKRERAAARDMQLRTPHRWFAWHPIKIGVEDCRWFEVVLRQRITVTKYVDCWGYDVPVYRDGWVYSAC